MSRGSRRRSRIRALQVLFEADIVRRPPTEVMRRHFQQEEIAPEAQEFIAALVRGVVEHQDEIDNEIARRAPAFPLTDMNAVDRNVLRLALFEILYDDDAPLRVVIDEAIELAKGYGSESSGRFVHGVLGAAVNATETGAVEPPAEEPASGPGGE